MEHEHCLLCGDCIDNYNHMCVTFVSRSMGEPDTVWLCGPCGVPVALICAGAIKGIAVEVSNEAPAQTLN